MSSHSVEYPNLRLLDMHDDLDKIRLQYLLSGRYHIDGLDQLDRSTYLLALQPELHLSAQAIIALTSPDTLNSLNASSVLVEMNYVDRDTYVAYTRLHARGYRDFPRRTVRLHFFREIITLEDLLDESAIRSNYLGFCVLPPNQSGPIGRTVLPPPNRAATYAPGQSRFSANLVGIPVEAEGIAFIEQDGRIAACATAALWMATVTVSKRLGLGLPSHSMAEITTFAMSNSVSDEGSSSSPGLTIQQMLWGLQSMGYESIVYAPTDPASARETLHAYIQSGIPPIIVVGFPGDHDWHAVTAVGYTFDILTVPTGSLNAWRSPGSLWQSHFLVHDDQVGLYIPLTIGEQTPATDGKPALDAWLDNSYLERHTTAVKRWYKDARLEALIIPMPTRHALGFEEALDKALGVMDAVQDAFPSITSMLPAIPIMRARFVASNEFKRQMQPADVAGLSRTLAVSYRASDYPRYVWVVEWCQQIAHENGPASLHVVADVTIDPTSSMRIDEFVTLHVPRAFFRMPAREMNLKKVLADLIFIPDDAPYQSFW